MREPTAPRRHSRTVTTMTGTTTARTLYQRVIATMARDLDDELPLLLLSATSLARIWELLDPGTVIRDGELHVPELRFNNMANIARTVPLGTLMRRTLGGRDGTVYDVLGMAPDRRGALLELHRMALSELELPQPISLEQLVILQVAALVDAAPTGAHAHATLAAAGIRANTVRARLAREDLGPEHFAWTADQTDRLLERALGLHGAARAIAR